MISHRQRLWALGLTALVSISGIIGLTFTEHTGSQAFALLIGSFTVAIAGWWDALRIETRRRNPRVPAIKDDVISEEAVNAETPTSPGNGP